MARPLLSCTLVEQPDQVTVVAAGEVDLDTCAVLHRAVEGALKREPATMVVDLQGVTFMSSEGLSELVWAMNHADRAGTHLVIIPSSMVYRILAVTGLVAVLDIQNAPQPTG